MTKIHVGGPFSFRKVDDPFDYRERGWELLDPYIADGTTMSLPSWLTFMCASGRDRPWRNWLGKIKPWGTDMGYLRGRDKWLIGDAQRYRLGRSGGPSSYSDGYEPVKLLGSSFWLQILKAPFPVTLDEGLIAYAACSIGETEWVPFAPLINGRCSAEMLRLMNCFPHKPAYIVYEGHLFVWINIERWRQLEPEVSRLSPSPYIELELFRAYRAYYELLVRELPMPYRGPVIWPDQCDPRFPLSSDPRGAHYGMWLYSGGLTYGEHAYGNGGLPSGAGQAVREMS